MEFNNKTILITGLIIASLLAMYLNYEQIALAIVSGLVGYLSKEITSPVDSVSNLNNMSNDDEVVEEDIEIESA